MMCGPMSLTSSGCICQPTYLPAVREYATDRDDLSARRLQYPTPYCVPAQKSMVATSASWYFTVLPYLHILPALGQYRCAIEVLSVVAPPHAFRRHCSMPLAFGTCRECTLHMAIGPVQEHADITDFLRHHIGANRMPQISKNTPEVKSAWLLTCLQCCVPEFAPRCVESGLGISTSTHHFRTATMYSRGL